MGKRSLTGLFIAIVTAGFFCLRQFVDYRIFYVFIFALSFFGTYEICRAVVNVNPYKTLYIIYGVVSVPLFFVTETFFSGYGFVAYLGIEAIFLITVIITNAVLKTKSFWYIILPVLYPSLLILFMLLLNNYGENGVSGFVPLVSVIAISWLADSFAYIVGSIIGGKKLCPRLSPKKTVSGAIGGIIGGTLGAILVNLVFKPTVQAINANIFFALLGVVGSVVSIAGDLFESYIKRKVNIKDMGNVLPGHGGIMDRIDGVLFVSLAVYVFVIIFGVI